MIRTWLDSQTNTACGTCPTCGAWTALPTLRDLAAWCRNHDCP